MNGFVSSGFWILDFLHVRFWNMSIDDWIVLIGSSIVNWPGKMISCRVQAAASASESASGKEKQGCTSGSSAKFMIPCHLVPYTIYDMKIKLDTSLALTLAREHRGTLSLFRFWFYLIH